MRSARYTQPQTNSRPAARAAACARGRLRRSRGYSAGVKKKKASLFQVARPASASRPRTRSGVWRDTLIARRTALIMNSNSTKS
ncbi:hypothetical protein D3C87_1381460 [compost metagenome]